MNHQALATAEELISQLNKQMEHFPDDYTIHCSHTSTLCLYWKHRDNSIEVQLPSENLNDGIILLTDHSSKTSSAIKGINIETLQALLDWEEDKDFSQDKS